MKKVWENKQDYDKTYGIHSLCLLKVGDKVRFKTDQEKSKGTIEKNKAEIQRIGTILFRYSIKTSGKMGNTLFLGEKGTSIQLQTEIQEESNIMDPLENKMPQTRKSCRFWKSGHLKYYVQ